MRNLNDIIPNAKSFKYKEFVFSNTAIRKGIQNIPTENQWLNIERLASNVLQPIRNQFGPIRISSGFRSEQLNISIGGSSTSNHCRGEASDFIPIYDISLFEITEWIYKNLKFRTLIYEFNEWIHIDYRQGGNLNRLKLKDSNHNYKLISLDYLKMVYR